MLQTETKPFELDGKKYILHKIPAVQGREILALYGASNVSSVFKPENYHNSKEIMLKALSYVGVIPDGSTLEIMLDTEDMVNNHVESTLSLLKLEKAIIQYNFDFLADGEILRYLNIVLKVADKSITKMLTGLSEVLFQVEKQPSEN